MPLNQEQLDRLQAWCHSKGVNRSCRACGRSSWEVGELIEAPALSGAFAMGGPPVPLVLQVCGHCASVRLFAAGPIGLIN